MVEYRTGRDRILSACSFANPEFHMIHYETSDGVCRLRIDGPPVGAISLGMLDELRAGIGRAKADDAVRAVVIHGDEKHFSAGADVGLFEKIETANDARRLSAAFQEAFADVENSTKPVVAAIAGHVMGGAIELAVACRLRVCTESTRLSMPEVNLGFNPGAGATQRLPRLIGPGGALRMMLSAKPLGANDALEVGLVDAVCTEGELLQTAVRLALAATDVPRTCDRADKISDAAELQAALAEAERRLAAFHPGVLGPRKIVEAVRVGVEESFEAGLRREREAFAECMQSPAAQNKVYVFFATRQTNKAPELDSAQPVPVDRAAVVGMGSMGAGIAQAFLAAGTPVTVFDADTEAARRGLQRIRKSFEKRVTAGRLTPERLEATLGMVRIADGWNDLAGVPLIVEAVSEDVDVKRTVLGELEAACGKDAILATNTSTISLDALAERLQRPGRLVGMHFFNPAHRMPLVEVIRRAATSPAASATAMQTAKQLRKTAVLVRNREGFLVNRLFLPYMTEAFCLLEEGAEPKAIDEAMVAFGMPMGPLALIDMAGIDILVSTDRVMSRAFPRHGKLSPTAGRLVAQGRLGQKSGGGVYDYRPDDHTPQPSETAAAIVNAVRRRHNVKPRAISAEEITDRLVLRMVSEAFWVLGEGIAQREADLDVATVLGIGFPDFRGGVVRYARGRGLHRVLRDLEQLADCHGERFAPSGLLEQMADS